MELSQAVRTGYYQALNGNIGATVYDSFVPPEAVYPYVVVTSQTSVQRWIKRCKIWDVQITLDIVTGSSDQIGMVQAEGIAESIDNIILPDTYQDINITANGYRIGDTRRSGDNQLTARNDLYYIYRKLLTYSLLVSEN